MEIRTLQSLAYFHVCCFYAFLTNAEADGSLDKVGIAAAVFALAAINWQWMRYGPIVGKDNTKNAVRARDFFMRQKWYGLFLFTFVLMQSGVFYAWRFHDSEGNRVYPIREV